MPANTENSKLERVRLVLGTILSLAGAFVLTIIGAFFGYSDTTVWISGLLLLVSGLLIAGSHKLSQLLTDILRM
ncbi:MAG TPA: hypothetical protein VFO38_00480 [Candidatus Saccharimonadales bacterium]|nr:hypothetical protein [Candidatus Saccharimonadales bacterium]